MSTDGNAVPWSSDTFGIERIKESDMPKAKRYCGKNDAVRDLCDRFIRNGGHFYDVLRRYDELTAYVLGREEATGASCIKWAIPFLKAFGATDHLMHQYSKETMELMPNAARTMNYISKILPTFITSSMYEHTMMEVMESLDAPLCETFCSKAEMDQADFGRAESRKIREMAQEVASLRIPKAECSVEAGKPVCSLMRLLAFPVGAASKIS